MFDVDGALLSRRPHNPLGPISAAACIHFGAAVPNFAWLEDRVNEPGLDAWDPHYFPKLLPRAPTIEEHATLGYPVPTAPGLGVEVNEEALQHQGPFVHSNPPFLRRLDGSITNW